MARSQQPTGRVSDQRVAGWAGLVFGGLGFTGFAFGLWMTINRLVVLHEWPEVEARVIESRVHVSGSQYSALIRVEFEVSGRTITTQPASDYRSSKHGWIAETVDRFPVGGTASVRHHPRDPAQARLDVGWNFNTFGLPLLLLGGGLVFGGVGVLAVRSARLAGAEVNAQTRAEAARLARGQYLGVAAFVGVIGLAMLGAGAVLLPPALAMRRWPVISARVEHTDIFTRSSTRDRHGGSTTFHVGRVFVAYDFGGKAYQSALILPNSSTDRAKTERMLATIRPGDARPVRVNPANPFEAERVDMWPLVLPGVFLIAGLVVTGVAGLILRSLPKIPSTSRP